MLGAVLFLGLLAPIAGAAPTQSKPDHAAELKKLEADYRAAQKEYFAPLRDAKTDEERDKIELDKTKHPARAFLPRYEELAVRARGTEAGLNALIGAIQLASGIEGAKDKVPGFLGEIRKDYLDSPALERFAGMLGYLENTIGEDQPEKLAREIIARSPHEEVVCAATLTLAQILEGADGKAATPERAREARALYERLAKEHAGSRHGKRAAGWLFEKERLQVGMTAPEIEGADENGKAFKLSELRGKVVALDFWGFW
jgi:hypothetical protein